jgi:hypothetical protein
MPVFAINADPTFDITNIARREGLDLFNEPRLQLIEALGQAPHNSQVERLWGDWPPRLEGNRNNLRAELERIIHAASARRDQNHVIVFVLNEFAPGNPAQHVSRDLLMEVKQAIEGRDRRGHGLETAAAAQNVWVVVFLRPAQEQEPERIAELAHGENSEGLVNNIFVSAFNGKESDRVAADFLVLRMLAEMLLDDSESRRFLQVGVQNAYPVTCVIGPTKAPSGGASALLRRALSATLDELQTQNEPPAGSAAISAPARQLSGLVGQLVARARAGIDVQPTVDTAGADSRQVELEIALGSASAADRLDAIFRAADARFRPRQGFGEVRKRLKDEIEREDNYHARESERWAQQRDKKLTIFSAINVDIGRAINELSKAAVGSRGNDIKVLGDLVDEVRRERDSLKTVAQRCRGLTAPAHDDAGMATQRARLIAAGRAFEFELDQMPDRYSMSFYLFLSLLPATVPFLVLASSDQWRMAIYLTFAVTLPVLVCLAGAVAIARRRRKLMQAVGDLRDEFASWREVPASALNQALRYHTATLAIGWLTSIREKLDQIKRSIELRRDALQDCREMLGTDAGVVDSPPDQHLTDLVTTSVEHLRTYEWDKWIVEFLRGARQTGMKAEVRVFLANDGETRIVMVPGLARVAAPGSQRADLEIRTPWSLQQPRPTDPQDPRQLTPA